MSATLDARPGADDDAPGRGGPLPAGAIVLVGDPDGAPVLLATDAATVDGACLQRLQSLAGGMVVLGLGERRIAALGLTDFDAGVGVGVGPLGLTLCAPVDAAAGLRGGWSPDDRARTVRGCAAPDAGADDLRVPGHVHTARIGGDDRSTTVAALELGRPPGGELADAAILLAAVTDPEGDPVTLEAARRRPELRALPVVSAAAVRGEALAARATPGIVECTLPTDAGRFRAVALEDPVTAGGDDGSVVALVHGDPGSDAAVHVHRACLLGDVFGSLLCDCRARLSAATEDILAAGAGVIVYVKPGAADPGRRYHCGADAPLDLAPVLGLLRACGLDPAAVQTSLLGAS